MRLKHFYYFFYYFWQKPKRVITFLKTGRVSNVEFQVNHELKLIYVLNPKVATSTITYFLAGLDKNDVESIKDHSEKQKKLGIEYLNNLEVLADYRNHGYRVFSFVRNPYWRLVSFFKNKYVLQSDGRYKKRAFAMSCGLDEVAGFADMVRRLVEIPDSLADTHFMPQYSILFRKSYDFSYDFIGRLEQFDEDFIWLKKLVSVDFTERPSQVNKTESKSNEELFHFFDQELEQLVYKRFKDDFDFFGYPRLIFNG